MKNEKALNDFIDKRSTILDQLDKLFANITDHCGVHPDDVNYGHVGNLTHVSEKLEEINTFLGVDNV